MIMVLPFPRRLIATRQLVDLTDDVLVLNVRNHTLSRGPVLVFVGAKRKIRGQVHLVEFGLVRALLLAFPKPLTISEVVERVWPDPDNEPDYSHEVIYSTVRQLRNTLFKLGLRLRHEVGIGYSMVNTRKQNLQVAA